MKEIKSFLFKNMYRAPPVMDKRARVTIALKELFPFYMENPSQMPQRWRTQVAQAAGDDIATARLVADYIAGMTDRYALQRHQEYFAYDVMSGV